MAFVYWIKAPHHTDMFSEGYIGYTSKDIETRFKKHIGDATTGQKRNYRLHHAIRKYKESLSISVVLEGSEEYCLMIEEKLRPVKNTGWNHNVGGFKPPSPKGRLHSKESVEKRLASRRRTLASETPEEREIRCEKYRGRKFSNESKEKMSQTAKARLPWKSSKANLNLWADSEWLYAIYSSFKTCGICKLSTACKKYTKVNLECIVERFQNNWNPSEDEAYLSWLSEYNKTKETENVA